MPHDLFPISLTLETLAGAQPEFPAVRLLASDGEVAAEVTFLDLARRTAVLASQMIDTGLQQKPVLIPERTSIDYVAAYFACLRAGAIAVTGYAPRTSDRSGRLEAIARDCQPAGVAASPATLETVGERLLPEAANVVRIRTDESVAGRHAADGGPPLDPIPGDWTAMYQYTSGSTSHPRAVMLTHSNLVANMRAMRERFIWRSGDLSGGGGPSGGGGTVCWLPLHHDMGIIGQVATPLLCGLTVTLMSPESFVMRPIRWLQAMSDWRAAHSGGPNFAFDMCVDRTTEAERAELDLSCWMSCQNGAEPIRASTIERFCEAFAPHGFDPAAMQPCYGLAEATLAVTARDRAGTHAPLTVRHVDREALAAGRLADVPSGGRSIVSCGTPLDGQQVRIVHPKSGLPQPSGTIGEVCVQGESVAKGYLHSERFQATFTESCTISPGRWLRTGDLGVVEGGELFITGRLKDIIVVAGGNHDPADIERSSEESHEAIARGGCAAFAVDGERGEEVVVVAELRRDAFRSARGRDEAWRELAPQIEGAITRAVAAVHGLRVAACHVVPPGTIPRTTSGKVRRHACAARWGPAD